MQRTCLVRDSCFSFLPTASAARPPMPASISSKTRVRCDEVFFVPTLSPEAGEEDGAPICAEDGAPASFDPTLLPEAGKEDGPPICEEAVALEDEAPDAFP